MKNFLAVIFFLVSAVAQAADISEAAHINADVNIRYARTLDSCLPNALEKINRLRSVGYEATLMIVHKHGAPTTHAIVRLRLDGVSYYLNNNTGVLATEWYTLYDVISESD